MRGEAQRAGDRERGGERHHAAIEGLADRDTEQRADAVLQDTHQRGGGARHVRVALQRHGGGVGHDQRHHGDVRHDEEQERPDADGAGLPLDQRQHQPTRPEHDRHDHGVAQDLRRAEDRREASIHQVAAGEQHDGAGEDQAKGARADAVALDEGERRA